MFLAPLLAELSVLEDVILSGIRQFLKVGSPGGSCTHTIFVLNEATPAIGLRGHEIEVCRLRSDGVLGGIRTHTVFSLKEASPASWTTRTV